MFLFLSKILPLLLYPLGLACALLAAALFLRRHPRWQTGLIVVALALLWLGGNRIVAMATASALEGQFAPPTTFNGAQAIVVLGGGTRSQILPRSMHELNEAGDRLLYAVRLYQSGVAPLILVSGGGAAYDSPDSVPPEAEAMADILTAMGVPREAITLEKGSRNTYENAVESKKLLDAAGVKRVVLVTSALHMPRAAAIFQKQGVDILPAPTDYLVTEADWEYYLRPELTVQVFNLIPSADDLHLTSQVIKEVIGMGIYRMRGWL